MKIGIYTNLTRDIDGQVADCLIKQINNSNNLSYTLSVLETDQYTYNGEYNTTNLEDMIKSSDIVIAIGGDGTVLKVTQVSAKYNIPVLGINAGNLGFLTHINAHDKIADEIISLLENGKYQIDNRTMLSARPDGSKKEYIALNEVLVCRNASLHVAKIKVYIDSILADEFTGDGVMVATPTGSTAYSLSCGGPVLAPDVNAFVINAVCPHILHGRPIVVSDDSEIILDVELEKDTVDIATDGALFNSKKSHVRLTIKKSKMTAKLIKIDKKNFYNTLLKKLNYA